MALPRLQRGATAVIGFTRLGLTLIYWRMVLAAHPGQTFCVADALRVRLRVRVRAHERFTFEPGGPRSA